MIYDTPGQGRKKCSQCGKYTGIRSSTCENCKNVFEKSTPKETKEVKTPKEDGKTVEKPGLNTTSNAAVIQQRIRHENAILTPAGKCPITLQNVESIAEWRSELKNHYNRHGSELADEAVIYFVRHFFDMRSPEYKQSIQKIKELIVGEKHA